MVWVGGQAVGIVGQHGNLQQAQMATCPSGNGLRRAILLAVQAHNYVAPASEE